MLLTCFNRKDATLNCIKTIYDDSFDMSFIVVDDGCTDGTAEAIGQMSKEMSFKARIIKGSGNLFWAGGMRKGMEYLLSADRGYDYLTLVNDDVAFEKDTLKNMIARSKEKNNAVISGATSWFGANKGSYGGVLYDRRKVRPQFIDISAANSTECDTMNCNCVLMPYDVFLRAGAFDSHYTHSMADFDYGFKLKRMGYHIWLTDFYVGKCDDNSAENTWRDNKLSRRERIKKKESPKGLPAGEWFYYLRKNFGLGSAIWHSLTPYIRILIGK